jgi:hypothetical protein
MHLRSARLCLDCEELHAEARCPVCASEAFAFVSRWVPVDEGRQRHPPRPRGAPPSGVARLVKGSAVGLAMFASARWLWQSTRPNDFPNQLPHRLHEPPIGTDHEDE